MARTSFGGLYLGYAAGRQGDGMGAQAQRLMAIFGAAQDLNFGYVHIPIDKIELNPGDPFSNDRERADFLDRVNALFALPGSAYPRRRLSAHFAGLTERSARHLRRVHGFANKSGIPVLAMLSGATPWCDINPSAYRHASHIIRQRIPARNDPEVFRIDAHIRRALSPAKSPDGSDYMRHIPTEWYVNILNVVMPLAVAHRRQVLLRVHTDLPSAPWKVPIDTSQGTLDLWNQQGLIGKNGYLRGDGEDFLKTFRHLGNVEVVVDCDPLDALASMVTADVLVTCASSFSYVAGLLRNSGLTVATPFWHVIPDGWEIVSRRCKPEEMDEFRRTVVDFLKPG